MNSTTRNIKELSEGEHVTLTFGAFKYVYLLALDEDGMATETLLFAEVDQDGEFDNLDLLPVDFGMTEYKDKLAEVTDQLLKNACGEHECWEHPVPYESDGVLGHGWECGICGNFLQAG